MMPMRYHALFVLWLAAPAPSFEQVPTLIAPSPSSNHRWGAGVCAGDVNNDGWEDLFVTNFGKSRLYMNDGDGTFTDAAEQAGVQVDTWATGCAFGDYNGDGLLDLYVAGYVDFDWDDPPPPGGSAARPPTETSGRKRAAATMPGTGAAYNPDLPACVYYGISVACGPKGLAPAADFLFRNEGDGRFRDVSEKSRVREATTSYGPAVAWVDVDDDGAPDIVVANDSMPNFLYRNRGDGTFEEIGVLSGLGTNDDGLEQAYMGIAVGDYNRDGRNDFFFTTFAGDNYTLHRNNGNLSLLSWFHETPAVQALQLRRPLVEFGTLDIELAGQRRTRRPRRQPLRGRHFEFLRESSSGHSIGLSIRS